MQDSKRVMQLKKIDIETHFCFCFLCFGNINKKTKIKKSVFKLKQR